MAQATLNFMFNKKNYILLIVLLVLITGAYLYVGPYQNRKKSKEGKNNFLSGIDINKINKVEVITADEEAHVIVKKGDSWKYADDDWPTEKILMDAMMEKLSNTVDMQWGVASINPEKKSSFDVATPKEDSASRGMRVKLYQNQQELAEFIIGRISSSYNSTYFSRPGDDKTYLVKETFIRAFDTESWRDRTIFNLNQEVINTVILKYPKQRVEITDIPDSRGEVYWRAVNPYTARLDKEKVEEFLGALAKLEASSIPKQTEQGTGLDNPSLQMQIKGEGIDEIIIIGSTEGEENKEYFLKKFSDNRIFLISNNVKEKVFKQLSDLK